MTNNNRATIETKISNGVEETVYIRGYDVLELIEQVDFGSVFYLLFREKLPSPAHSKMLNAILVSVCDHGIVPSSLTTRILTSCGVPIQSAVAAGVTSIADRHGGACQELSRWLQDASAKISAGAERATLIEEFVDAYIRNRKPIPGFGHALHPGGDPRAISLINMAERLQIAGAHVRLLKAVADELERKKSKRIDINVDGAISAIGSDMGFPWEMARAFVFVSRAAGLAAHAIEEEASEEGWGRWSKELDWRYVGQSKRTI